MRRKIMGAAGGAALTAGLVATLMSTGGASAATALPQGDGSHAAPAVVGTRPLAAAAPSTGPESAAGRARAAGAAGGASAGGRAAATGSTPAAVRKLTLTLPASADYGTTVSGLVTLADVTKDAAAPVAGVPVSFLQLRGTKFVAVSSGVTDANGQAQFGFTSTGTLSWKAVADLGGGRTLTSPTVRTVSDANVTWAARPVMQAQVGEPATYAFRVSPATAARGQLQYALSATKPKWSKSPVVVAGAGGVVTVTVTFPKAGTYLVRGASVATGTVGSGTTTALTVVVS